MTINFFNESTNLLHSQSNVLKMSPFELNVFDTKSFEYVIIYVYINHLNIQK